METLVFTFETSKQKHIRAIAELVGRLYKDKPVGSVAIGENYGGIEHAQVLKYLHKAKELYLVNPVYSGPKGIIRGWVPAWVDASGTILGEKVRRAVDAVKSLHKKSKLPVPVCILVKHLNTSRSSVDRLMNVAGGMGLVRMGTSPWGWLPA
jgi:hypothetical protein